jgi:cation diffusion facilitator CzcD-associated flavoprotein CzcO
MPENDVALDYDVVVVGAGFSGLALLHRLRGQGLRAHLFEAGAEVGGTWFWNRYPGARCDFDSLDYSFGFDDALQQEWTWSRRFSEQPEILDYLKHVADRYGLRESISLEARVVAARYDESGRSWSVDVEQTGLVSRTVTTRLLVLATGALSAARVPEVPGLEVFAGQIIHTADWPQAGVDLRGKRVAVVGTGSSGAQVIPRIAEQADHLVVLQRTAGFVVPAHNRDLDADEQRSAKAGYREYQTRAEAGFLGVHFDIAGDSAMAATPDERSAAYEDRWKAGGPAILAAYPDILNDHAANDTLADFIRGKIREEVDDPSTAEKLLPSGFPVGSKRLVIETDYYRTFNRDDVELVDLRAEPLAGFDAGSVRVGERDIDIDIVVFATGFDAVTGSILAIDIRGADGATLREAWAAGPTTYLGLASAGFPNLLIAAGPQSPGALSNVVRIAEFHADWIAAAASHLHETGRTRIEAAPEAQKEWGEHVQEVASATLLTSADSWFVGANVPGKPRVFMLYAGGFPGYCDAAAQAAENGYRGFVLD